MKKYLNVAIFKFKTEFEFLSNYVFSLFAFAIHIIVFNFLWDYLLKDKLAFGYSKDTLIWYIIIGELITYCATKGYREISTMVKNGDIANMLVKPINFALHVVSERMSNVLKIVINLIFAILLGIVFTGYINITIVSGIFIGISLLLGCTIMILLDTFVGLLAFFFEETKSFSLVISKLSLLLVITPLEFFPLWLQGIFKLLPTTYAVYAPAKIFVMFDIKEAILLIIGQIISILIVSLLIYAEYKIGVKKINVNGG